MDRIGKCCDFVSNNSKYNQLIATGREDDEGFIIVEKQRIDKNKKKGPNPRNQVNIQYMTYNPHHHPRKKGNKPQNRTWNNRNFNRTKFVNAGAIHSEWQVIADITIPQLEKKKIEYSLETLAIQGEVCKYKPQFEQIRSKKPFPLTRHNNFPLSSPNTFDDQYLLSQYKSPSERDAGKNLYYMTDNLFFALCSLQKNQFPWNLRLMKNKNKFILYSDLKDPAAAFINLSTYNENLQGHLPEDENELGLLCFETTLINQNFLRTCTNPDETQSKTITDFSNSKIIDLPVMYHYSRIELAKTNVVYTRAPVEAYVDKDGAPAYLLVKSLMNIEGSAWLKNWENNKSLCLNTMYKNNKSVIFNWLCQSV